MTKNRGTSRQGVGGYDDGYTACAEFWPDRPGSVLRMAADRGFLTAGGTAVDLGCGEGTNANWLLGKGFSVEAVDVSPIALRNARRKYPTSAVSWRECNATDFEPRGSYDLTVTYGLMHCLTEPDIFTLLTRIHHWTNRGGLLALAAFNSRSQDIERAHPGFDPTLLSHTSYLDALGGWEILYATDEDLHEIHPHNDIPHRHSMTRILARRANDRARWAT